MLKGQHPDYELFTTGVHYNRGVACADCHMPYKVEGGMKFTDHHIQSPLNNIANSCQVCHRESVEKLLKDVYTQQDKVLQIRRITERALAKAHIEAKTAWEKGATTEEMAPVLQLIRHAQWRWDWVAASNGMGFHSPVEVLRVLGTSIQKAEEARGMISVILVRHGAEIPVSYPDITSKALAQAYIGLNMDALRRDKQNLLNKVVKDWDKKTKK
jgi:nitrite reductase (cytochrome c-552)